MTALIHSNGRLASGLALILILVGALTAVAAERVAIPPPPGGGEGERTAPLDLAGPYTPGTQARPDDYRDIQASAALLRHLAGDKSGPDGTIGGDDITISEDEFHRVCSMDIASNGDIYIALETGDLATTHERSILVFRSQDGGTTWQDWGAFHPALPNEDRHDPSLHIAEGVVDRCYLAYNFTSAAGFNIMVSHSDLSSASGSWTTVTAMSASGVNYFRPKITSDAVSFSGYYLYLVAYGYDGDGKDIWFNRSINQAATFETPYMIGEMPLDDRDYKYPDVAYGLGGYVHVAWDFSYKDDSLDGAIRYRRAGDYGNGGLGAWGSTQYLSPTNDSIWDSNVTIAASVLSNDVLVVHRRYQNINSTLEAGQFCSHNQGVTFPEKIVIPGWLSSPRNLDQDPVTGNWILGGGTYYPWDPGIQRATAAAPTVWSAPEWFVDDLSAIGGIWGAGTALDPSRNYRVAAAWVDLQDPTRYLRFDAEWRTDPGYPDLEIGFPVALTSQSRSAPAVVDLDGDGYLEIVFGDDGGSIQAYRHDGTPQPGWPVSVGEALSDGPVAIGDLRGNGDMLVVVGAQSGRVYCYDAQGQVAAGDWPYDPGLASPAFVAIGAFGQGPYPRGIALSVGNKAYFLDHHGGNFPGTIPKTLARNATHAPAIGDVDGDGLPEVVVAHEEVIVALSPFPIPSVFGGYRSTLVSGSPTLGDFDLDGDYEVVVPLDNGTLHVLDDDGNDIPGFPAVSSTASPLSSAAIGQMLGTSEPEIVTAASDWTVHLFWYDGVEGAGWPNGTDGWRNYGSPIIGRVEGPSSDAVLGSRGKQAWAWGNLGSLIPGWPKVSDFNFYLAPAMGDIDLDGSNEIVLLSTNHLLVVDVHESPNDPSRTWGMAGHDPRRTGCSDCPEDLVTPVGDDLDVVTRVSFALPSPNPSSGSAIFRFAVPGPAVINLEVFDVRGHRVSLVTREEVDMGQHVVSWGGLNDHGQPLASGLYFARLRVQGPGIDEVLTRKVTLAR